MICLDLTLLVHRARRLADDRQGGAAVEFALVAPVLLLIAAGAIDGARLITRGMQANAAAQAGADYVQRHGWNEAGVRSAVTAANGVTTTLDPAPRQFLGCVVGGAVVETTAVTCAGGRGSGKYILISARANFAPLMPWPGFVVPQSLRGQAMVRTP
jgi:Flp pilus assembly protein TadG